MQMGKNEIRQSLESKLSRYFGVSAAEATKEQMYKACAMTVKDILAQKRKDGTLPFLRPDGKSQVTIKYSNGIPKFPTQRA